MKSAWRRHAIVCLTFCVLALPVYWLDRALLGGNGSSTWVSLDFRGLIFWSYVTVIAIHLVVSSIAVMARPAWALWRIQVGSIVLSAILLVVGCLTYEKLRDRARANERAALMESRKALLNVIELKSWSYYPDEVSPKEIRTNVVVHEAGRFAGRVSGSQTDASGAPDLIFQSTNGPETQRQVKSGDAFEYVFPLETLRAGRGDDVRITLDLFKAPSGPAAGDIMKVFMRSPPQEDDGKCLYGALPAPSR